MGIDTEDEDSRPIRGRATKTAAPRQRSTSPNEPSPKRLSTRSRTRSHTHRSPPNVQETKLDSDSDSDYKLDSDSELEITTRTKTPLTTTPAPQHPPALTHHQPPTRDYDITGTDDVLGSSDDHHSPAYPPSPPFSLDSDSTPPTKPNRTNNTIALSDSTVTQSDDNPPPLSQHSPPATNQSRNQPNNPNIPSNTPAANRKPLSYADVIREANSDASSDSDRVPPHMRSRFLRPSGDDLKRLLAMAEKINSVPLPLKLDLMEPAMEAIEKARPYTRCPEVTWVYFPRPDKVVQKGKTRNVLGLCEKFHYKFTLGEQDPVFSQWKDQIGRFEYSKLHDKNIVRVHLASHEAREALIGKPMDLGYFGLVTLQSAPIDPWADIQYIDIPNLPFPEWPKVATGLAALGAFPFFYGHRQGLNNTHFSDDTPRFYFGKEFPQCLTIGGKLPRQISYGGRLYLVFVKDYSPPRLDNPRIPCNELITIHPPTRKASEVTAPRTNPPESKRTRRNPSPTPTTTRRPRSPSPPPIPTTTNPDSDTTPDETFHIILNHLTATPDNDDDMGVTPLNPNATLWTPLPDVDTTNNEGPHTHTPARLFEPGNCTYKTMGFPYRRLAAQFVTLKRGSHWPTDLTPAIRRLRQHQGRLVLSPAALTMQSLDKWIEEQEKALTSIPETMANIDHTIDADLVPVHDAIVDHTHSCQPHAVLKILQSKYVAGQCALASLARDSTTNNSTEAVAIIHQHFFQRVLSATTPLHCCAFTTKFTDLYKLKPTATNINQALHSLLDDPLLLDTLPNRPQSPLPLTVRQHELALAWFELHLLTQAPTFFLSHEAHSLLAGGMAVNRLPCWNSEILPSWLLQSIVQSPLGRTVIKFMHKTAPDFIFNQILLQETKLPIWPYPTMAYLNVVKQNDVYVARWTPLTEFPPQTPLTSLQRAVADPAST